MHLAIIISAYNEEKVIGRVINALPHKIRGIHKISAIAVNDGSADGTIGEIKKTKAKLINHVVNLGYGSATKTGLEAAKKIGADIAVTLDGDGQHDPKDIRKVIEPVLKKEADLVIGTRLIRSRGMPAIKKFGNIFLNLVTYILSGYLVSDSQSGFRAFSRGFLKKIKLSAMGYEICSETIIEAARFHARVQEIPIRVIYSKYSKKKGQSILNGLYIVSKLISHRLRG
ncbi:MAG: glycosyltransferase family 2 protein [Candidatus Berkelbacteria bacterium]|nr:glycosyltransferase family 2 protein [Candidatus Berkelbacteria bacterium]